MINNIANIPNIIKKLQLLFNDCFEADEEYKSDDYLSKPFPNEHAARQTSPKKYKRFRRQKVKGTNGVYFIFGILEDGTSEVQSIRFLASSWTPKEAKKWLKKQGYSYSKFEVSSKKSDVKKTEEEENEIEDTNENSDNSDNKEKNSESCTFLEKNDGLGIENSDTNNVELNTIEKGTICEICFSKDSDFKLLKTNVTNRTVCLECFKMFTKNND